jgi:hypothetical protein
MDDREPAAHEPVRVDCVQKFARQKRIMALGLFGLLLLTMLLLLVCFFLFEGSPLSSWYPVGIVTIILIMGVWVMYGLRCPACGVKSGLWSRFCSRCGARLKR